MAKKKETLASPFVPAEEQPYPIPENWCWIHLLDSFENHTDSKKKVQSKTYLENGELAVVDQGQELIGGYTDDENMTYSGKLPVIVFGDHTRCIKYIDFPFAQGADGVKVLLPKSFYDVRAFYFALQSIDIPNMGYRRHYPLFPQFCIPVPPLHEQHRIVSRIESLFAKLDEAKEKAQAVVDGVELRKSAILHKAFTGELTERWRKEHGVGLESWKIVLFNDCIQKMQNGLAKRSGSIGESYVVLRLANLSEDGFDTSNLREILLDEKEQETYSLLENDVIMIRVNGSKDNVGRQLLVPDVKKWAFCDHIIRIRYQNNILPDYMVLFSKSDNYRTYVKDHMVSSAGQNTISRKGIANMAVPVPECDEQKEIVRTLSVLFNKEQQAKEAAEAVLTQIDTMKKAILARAFRGELGTNDPAEKWSGEMVKAVL